MKRIAAIAVVAAVIVAVGASLWRFGVEAVPLAPRPAELAGVEPAVATMIGRACDDVDERPRDASRWRELGMIYDANELDGPAAFCYEQAAALGDQDPRTFYHMGIVHQRLGNPDLADHALREAARRDDVHAPTRWRRGLLLLDRGDLDGAERAFDESIQLDSRDSAGWLGLARVRLERGDAEQAARGLEELLSWTPVNTGYAWQLLATSYRRLGRTTDAEQAAARGAGAEAIWNDLWRLDLMRYRPGHTPRLRAASELARSGRLDDAISILEDLHRAYPEQRTVTINLADNYRVTGRLDESVQLLADVLASAPDDHRAHLGLAATYGKISQTPGAEATRARETALEHADRAIEINPDLVEAYGLRGNVLVLDGRLEEAVEAYLEADRRSPTAKWLYLAAIVQMRLERWAPAAANLETVVDRDPTHVDAHRGRGMCYYSLGHLDDAQAAFERARALRPDDPAIAQALMRLQAQRNAPGG